MITYYLGAGASIKAIPVVETLKKEMNEFKKNKGEFQLQHTWKNNADNRLATKTPNETADIIFHDLETIINEMNDFRTIDTYAKHLFIREETEKYNSVKAILNIFLIHRQFQKPVDTRYLSFLATVLEKSDDKITCNDDFSVISWNYDLQWEIALMRMLNVSSLTGVEKHFNYKYKNSTVPSIPLLRLNGKAGYKNEGGIVSPIIDEWQDGKGTKEELLYHYLLFKNKQVEPYFHFAWDDNRDERMKAKDILKNTDVLVVLGYSFPDFNRDIDKQLLATERYKQIIIQNTKENIDIVTERFCAIADKHTNDKRIIKINDEEQFYIPYEMKANIGSYVV